jgi:hypothetical protein
MSSPNGNFKTNRKNDPMDEDTTKELIEQQVNTQIAIANDPVTSNTEVVKRNFISRFFKKEKKENHHAMNKKPAGPKLKTFEIVCIISR